MASGAGHGYTWAMRFLVGAAILGLSLAPAAAAGGTADKDTVEFAKRFLEIETSELPPELIPRFMEIEPATLPAKLRQKAKARQIELDTLLKISQSGKKPPIRRLGKEPLERCPKRREDNDEVVKMLRNMGFQQIGDEEEAWLEQKTNCTECELMEEFSLEVILVRPKKQDEKKGKEPPWMRYYLLHDSDPLTALLAQYRQGATGQGTNFFGTGFFGSCR